jgi:PAS domain-containing protein
MKNRNIDIRLFKLNFIQTQKTFYSMPAQPLELILARQFGDSLSLPMFLVDPDGNLLFYNEPAESIFGLKFNETGGMRLEEWATIFKPTDHAGNPLAPDNLPLVKTLSSKLPANGEFYVDSLIGVRTLISVSTFPIMGKTKRFLGAMAIFLKSQEL